MIRALILVVLNIISFYYCFRLGYIWTAYGHGGQILGVPFAIIMLISTVIFMTRKSRDSRHRCFIFCIIYFLTLASFSATIEIVRAKMENYFAFLYYEPGGYVNKIFLGWTLLGGGILTWYLLYSKKSVEKKSSSTNH